MTNTENKGYNRLEHFKKKGRAMFLKPQEDSTHQKVRDYRYLTPGMVDSIRGDADGPVPADLTRAFENARQSFATRLTNDN